MIAAYFQLILQKRLLQKKAILVSCFNQMENSDLKTLVSLQTEELYNEQQYTCYEEIRRKIRNFLNRRNEKKEVGAKYASQKEAILKKLES